jgi:hypothetical protein
MKEIIEQAIELLKGYLDFNTKDWEDASQTMQFFSNPDHYIWVASKLKTLELVLKGLENEN